MSAINRDAGGRFSAAEATSTGAAEPQSSAANESATVEPTEPQSYTPEDVAKLRSEAAKYRQRLRDSEQTVAQLRARVDTHDRAEALRIASGRLLDPEDLFVSRELDSLRGEDGALSPELVEQAVSQVAKDHPHWAQPVPNFDGGVRGGLPVGGSFGDRLKSVARSGR